MGVSREERYLNTDGQIEDDYRNRYGLISTNIHTQVKTIKKSGYWYKQMADDNGFDLPDHLQELIVD